MEQLALSVNGWLGRLGLRAQPAAPPVRRAPAASRGITVPSRYEEDEQDDLYTATASLAPATLRALEKQLRSAGFRNAKVSGYSGPDVGGTVHVGFLVSYDGASYYFGVDEIEPDKTGRYSPLRAGGNMRHNPRGIYHGMGLSDGDLVLHEDHRNRWRVDLIGEGGTHLDVSPPRGFASKGEAHTGAERVQHIRALGATTIWVQQGDSYVPYEGTFERNARRLPSETDSPETERAVLQDFRGSSAAHHWEHGPEAVFEHGRWWVNCSCGAQWSAVDTSRGFEFEQVSEGDDEDYDAEPYLDNAKWTRKYIDSLPDSAFLYVDRSCAFSKDREGRSHPLSCRHFPYRNRSGRVDVPHLRNALSRIPQSSISLTEQSRAMDKAERLLSEKQGMATNGDLYAELVAAGCQVDHHESDLYVLDTPEARAILAEHPDVRATAFRSDVDHKRWLDVPFAYSPFWAGKQQRNGRPNGSRSGVLSDGSRVDVYHRAGAREPWVAQLDYADTHTGALYNYLVMGEHPDSSNARFVSEARVQRGDQVPWPVVPPRIKSYIERAVAPSELVANAARSVADPTAQRELMLYIENEYALIGAPNSVGRSIDASLRKKVQSGQYDSKLAPKAWLYLADAGAKKYQQDFGSGGAPIFNLATRSEVAKELAEAWEAENLRA